MDRSVRAGLAGIGYSTSQSVSLRGEFKRHVPSSLRPAVVGMSDPEVASWAYVGDAISDGGDFGAGVQGMISDASRWYVVSNEHEDNGNDARVRVYPFGGPSTTDVGPDDALWAEWWKLRSNTDAEPHLGAPALVDGALLVPTQNPDGVWILTDELQHQEWWPDPTPSHLFPWIAWDPNSGLLFSSPTTTDRLEALEWQTLKRLDAAIVL
jgi:hypothetical protein